jgi:starvation-inducible DNA-binding protein
MTMGENVTKPAEAASPLSSQPWLHQHSKEIQAFGTVRQFPLALAYETRMYACPRLNQILADTQILYALYKKHHWLMRGATFYTLDVYNLHFFKSLKS